MKKLLFIAFAAFMSIGFVSCSKDDNKDDNEGNKTTQGESPAESAQTKVDYTATKEVKEVNLIATFFSNGGINIYEDFNYKYELILPVDNRELCLQNFKRKNGVWNGDENIGSGPYGELPVVGGNGGFEDFGKCNGLSDITSKAITPGCNFFRVNTIDSKVNSYYHCIVQPNHGYAAYFTTEDGDVKYLRIFLKDYTLSGSGTLNSITIQYQLY